MRLFLTQQYMSNKIKKIPMQPLLNNVYNMIYTESISPDILLNSSEYGDNITLKLIATSGLKKSDKDILIFKEIWDDSIGDIPTVIYGVKVLINDILTDFIIVSDNRDGMFYSAYACERRTFIKKYTLSIANLIADIYKTECICYNNKKLNVVIQEEDNLGISDYILCTSSECDKKHSSECYECLNNKTVEKTYNERYED